MRSQRFSTSQLLSLGSMIVLFPALRLFPAQTAEEAGRAGWLCAFAALPLSLGYAFFLRRLLDLTREGEYLPEALPRLLGKRAGQAALLLTALWTLLYAAFVLRSGADRLVGTIYPRSAWTVFSEIMGLLALAAALSTPRALVRMARMLRPLLLGTLLVLLGFAAFSVRPENLWPVTSGELLPVCRGALGAVDISCGALAALCFLAGGTDDGGPGFRQTAGWLVRLALLLALLSAAVTGVFGHELTAQLSRPFFVLVRTLVFFRTVERVEALIVMLWVFPDFLLASLFLWIGQFCLRLLWGKDPGADFTGSFDLTEGRILIWLAAAGVLALSLVLAPDAQSLERWSRGVIPALNLLFSLVLLPAVYVLARLKIKKPAGD
jgi:hypothetical protein